MANRWTCRTAWVGRRGSGGDGNQLSGGDAMLPAAITVTVTAGTAAAIAVVPAGATKTSGSASAPAFPLGRLTSRTRPSLLRRPDARSAEQRDDPDPSPNAIGASMEIVRACELASSSAAGAGPTRRSRCPTRRCSGRRPSALGRGPTSRGRAAHEMNEGRRASPAVLPSTITYGLRR